MMPNSKVAGLCGCGRSPTGKCLGWHALSEDLYQHQKMLWLEEEERFGLQMVRAPAANRNNLRRNKMEAVYRGATEVNSAMLRVYNNMSLAVITSMVVSYLVSTSPALMQFFFTGVMKWIVIFAPLAMIFAMSWAMTKATKLQAQTMLQLFAALMGLSMSSIFVVYTGTSIIGAFFGAAILFITMSVYGYFTKTSLDSMGKFMIVGLIAIILASIVNIFIGSTVMQMVISALAIIIFLGLTAYDTQKIREMVSQDSTGVAEVSGALNLYMDFINLFINLLQLFGGRKE
jgi:FtsH-binding integral membrane protein